MVASTVIGFDHELAERLAGDIIEKTEAHSVMEMLELERLDLVSEGIARAVRDWPTFNPTKAQPQTFLYMSIRAGIFDYLRREGSQSRRVQAFAAGGTVKQDKSRELADWLADVYAAAKRMYGASHLRQGRRLHEAPQLIAVAALMEHEQLSSRGCARLLATRDELRAILRMDRLPHWTWINKARKLAKRCAQVATQTPSTPPEVATANT